MRQYSQISVGWLFVVYATTILCGCRLHRPEQPACCPPYVSQRGLLELAEKQPGLGVTSDFAAIGEYRTGQGPVIEPLASGNAMAIDLNEALCAAARNSELAELIEAQWHAFKCRVESCDLAAWDSLIEGEALEQRNKAAGAAGRLFLGLVEVQLQRELLAESRRHVDELAETIRASADQGFATAAGEDELSAARIRIKSAESKLNSSEQELICQLNALINIDSANLIALRPVYELKPADIHLDPAVQLELAVANRPGVRGLETALSSGLQPMEIIQMLVGQLGSELEMQSGSHPIEKLIFRRILTRKVDQQQASTPAANTRSEQLERMLAGRVRQARTETRVALIKMQSSLEKLSIANEKIATLNAKAVQLQGKQELDARGTYLEIHKNWSELQTAKSDRISIAIGHETAIIELLQAEGLLLSKCGFCSQETISIQSSERNPIRDGTAAAKEKINR